MMGIHSASCRLECWTMCDRILVDVFPHVKCVFWTFVRHIFWCNDVCAHKTYPERIITLIMINPSPLHLFLNKLAKDTQVADKDCEWIVVIDSAKIQTRKSNETPLRGSLKATSSNLNLSFSDDGEFRWKSLNGSNPRCAGLTCPSRWSESLVKQGVSNPSSALPAYKLKTGASLRTATTSPERGIGRTATIWFTGIMFLADGLFLQSLAVFMWACQDQVPYPERLIGNFWNVLHHTLIKFAMKTRKRIVLSAGFGLMEVIDLSTYRSW